MEHNKLVVTLERDGRTVVLVFRSDDFAQSVRNGKLRWGGGRAWTVTAVEAYTEPRAPKIEVGR